MADRTYTLTPSMSDRDADAATTEDLEDDPTCGYEGCKRTVDNSSQRCWQHEDE